MSPHQLSKAIIAAAFPQLPPDDRTAMPLMPEEEIAASRAGTLARVSPHADTWLFGYGSLMWRPEMEFAEQRIAHLKAWHRRFCLWQWRYRGSRERPGLMMALDRGGSCSGVAFRIAAPN
ncbi:MAG: gamma-glutamylcyclotransferase, partial [Rhizobiales bacterium]|nr:gamma-glutamylcyclotransferase [Hyphomicrobiales bacterium]